MLYLPEGKTVIIFGKKYVNEVPDALAKHLPKGLIQKPVSESTTKPKSEIKK